MKATDCKCNECGDRAEVFVGLQDPDATQYPKCRKHADLWRLKVIMNLIETDKDYGKGR